MVRIGVAWKTSTREDIVPGDFWMWAGRGPDGLRTDSGRKMLWGEANGWGPRRSTGLGKIGWVVRKTSGGWVQAFGCVRRNWARHPHVGKQSLRWATSDASGHVHPDCEFTLLTSGASDAPEVQDGGRIFCWCQSITSLVYFIDKKWKFQKDTFYYLKQF